MGRIQTRFFPTSENTKNSRRFQNECDDCAKSEHWVTHTWRPAMAWSYMAICLFDFIIAPTGTSILITFYKSTVPVWKSLSLENGGIIHVAFGAILGVAAWGRTKESVINTETNANFAYSIQPIHGATNETEEIEPKKTVKKKPEPSPDQNLEEDEEPVEIENDSADPKELPAHKQPISTEPLYDTMRMEENEIEINRK